MPESNALLSVHDYADDRIHMHGRRERGAESGARPGAGLGDWRGLPNILQPGSRLAAVSWVLRLSCSVRVVGLLWLVFSSPEIPCQTCVFCTGYLAIPAGGRRVQVRAGSGNLTHWPGGRRPWHGPPADRQGLAPSSARAGSQRDRRPDMGLIRHLRRSRWQHLVPAAAPPADLAPPAGGAGI